MHERVQRGDADAVRDELREHDDGRGPLWDVRARVPGAFAWDGDVCGRRVRILVRFRLACVRDGVLGQHLRDDLRDEVYGVHRFNREELEEPPATVARAARSFTRGVFRWSGEIARPVASGGPPSSMAPGGRPHTVGYLDREALFLTLSRSLA